MAKLTDVHQALNECIIERDALAKSHTALMGALERALPVVVEAHKMTHSQGTPTESCSRCEQIAADHTALAEARKS